MNINSKGSKIIIQKYIFSKLKNFISKKINKILIISDINVSKIYMKKLVDQLSEFKIEVFLIEEGEKSKSLKTIEEIYNLLSMKLFSRSDLIISFGGGVVSDISGFVASTYKRGMDFISIPTSLLGMIDASIGGKNGINLDLGKNLVGSFYNPKLILIDSDMLETLPEREIQCGIAEVIKYGCIKDEYLFKMLEENEFKEIIDEVINRSIAIKTDIVERDEYDKGERMILNFGHTIGHAIEKLFNYDTISHGQAVSIGMNMITKISEKNKLTKEGTAERLALLCQKYSLPTKSDIQMKDIYGAILNDKKILDGHINLVFLKEIGEGYIHEAILSKENDEGGNLRTLCHQFGAII